MRIELPKNVERFGAICFGGLQKVFELDSGIENGSITKNKHIIERIPYHDLCNIYKEMAIIIPVRNERLRLLDGVLCGIPHHCLPIIVSNSPLEPNNRFAMEEDALGDFCTFTNRNALIAHQKDPRLAKAFAEIGYTEILDGNGNVRDGKAEGMLIGTILARLAGKKYIGFVDADNYFPGSVEEYIREYASGFTIGSSPYTMVRIAWHSKPKIIKSKLFFKKWGRTSSYTNKMLNKLIGHYTGFETEIVKTGNAGEHAMTMDLAMVLDYSSGYSIEPYHIVNLLEKFGGILESPLSEVMKRKVEVFQIGSRNPHLHEVGNEDHIDRMLYLATQVVYHSPICPEALKDELKREMVSRKLVKSNEDMAKPSYFPVLSSIDYDSFMKSIRSTPYAKMIHKLLSGKI